MSKVVSLHLRLWRALALHAIARGKYPDLDGKPLFEAATDTNRIAMPAQHEAYIYLFGALRLTAKAWAHGSVSRRVALAPALKALGAEALSALDPPPEPVAVAQPTPRPPLRFRADIDG